MAENQRHNITFIINPIAGIGGKSKLETKILEYLDLDVFNCHFRYTEYKNHAREITEEIISHNKIIVAVGGDGTINEIAHVLLGSDTILAIIPRGSGNGLAREIGIPFKLKKCIGLINDMKSKYIDVGKVNDTYFFNSFGLGLIHDIAYSFDNFGIRGLVGYAICTIKHLFKARYLELKIKKDDKIEHIRVKSFDVLNIAQFGYNFKFLPHVKIDDGMLHLLSFRNLPPLRGIWMLILLKFGFLPKYPDSIQYSFQQMEIIHSETNAQIDGELITLDQKKLHIQCLPELLKVIV